MLTKYIAFGIYLVILAIITWLSAKQKNIKDFLFASHDIGWKQLSLSIFSSVISSYNVVLTLTFSFLFGPYFILIFLGALVAFVGIYFIAKKYKSLIQESGFNNVIDIFAHLFDSKVATILNFSFMVVLFLFIALQFFINTSIFKELMGWDKYISSIIVGFVVLLYTTIGGLKAEIYTDIFQGILMFLIIILVFMVDTSVITGEILVEIISDRTIFLSAIWLALSQFLTMLVQPELWQRVAAAKSISHIKKAFVFSWILIILFIIPEIIIGLSARAGGNITDHSNLFYDILATSTPSWFLPFIVVGLFSAFMSTLDSSLFAISSQIGKYGLIVKKDNQLSNSIVAKRTRISIVLITLLALTLSLFFANFLTAVFGMVSLLTVISVIIIASILFKISSNQTFVTILVGISVFVFCLFGGYITQEPVTALYPSFVIIGYMVIQSLIFRIYRLFVN